MESQQIAGGIDVLGREVLLSQMLEEAVLLLRRHLVPHARLDPCLLDVLDGNDLGEEDVRPFGDAMPVAAMRARDAIADGQARAHPDRDGLLADVGMHRAVDLAGHPQLDGQLVELPDQDHRPQHLRHLRFVERHGVTSPSVTVP